ncbi:hypothetical protein PVAND_015104 [Polypedilum vanderplanki]|uniref:Lipase n=1 Tax=Polypedilum vanderplanki TaxID=319348 RepID=A0A9J6BB48_POLVA|nr:hypothetical protein PVAND_015104 [Polypedilum vanderplanki]
MRFLIFVLIFFKVTSSKLIKDDEVVKFVKGHGYLSEAHEVVTDDNYILRIHRVARKNGIDSSKKPVFLMHSAFSNSLYYLNTPNISAGFFFADEGYDVWLGNVRGSKYATKHKYLDTESLKYWQFSFHEMGVYDLKTMIDYTLQMTGSDSCFYIAHSQACTQQLVFLSMLPEYNKKIIQSHLMSPIGAMANPRFPLTNLAPLYLTIAKILNKLPYVDFKPFNVIGGELSYIFCSRGIVLAMCQLFNFFLLGGDPMAPLMPNTDPHIYQTIFPTLSPRTGVQQVTHYVQTIMTKEFRAFDYGEEKNLKIYGTKKPPLYPLNRITSPIYLYAGEYDMIFRRPDTELLLPHIKDVHYEIIPKYNHIDFIYARDAQAKMYKKIQHIMERGR